LFNYDWKFIDISSFMLSLAHIGLLFCRVGLAEKDYMVVYPEQAMIEVCRN